MKLVNLSISKRSKNPIEHSDFKNRHYKINTNSFNTFTLVLFFVIAVLLFFHLKGWKIDGVINSFLNCSVIEKFYTPIHSMTFTVNVNAQIKLELRST